ncbi:MAG TPA: 3-dehydroquinate synthase II [Candidatus Acidoferrum sp.]|nr:3-dehydroquinate synthase II [Candidatus Acidoferrum sp.]
MKELWIRIDPNLSSTLKTELLKQADGRCNVAILNTDDLKFAAGLKVKTASSSNHSDIQLVSGSVKADERMPAHSAVEIVVKESADEARALQLAENGATYLIIQCPNWKIIPLENLISKAGKEATLLAEVSNIGDAKTALQTLELGVDGVVINPKSPEEIVEISNFLKEFQEVIPLLKAKILSVKPLRSGARVCVDTTELMKPGEGMLVGSQSSGMFLIEAEVHRNPHVEPRPFRVNAGPVSAYVLTPGFRTRYLSELKTGDEILIVDRTGKARPGHVGRVKIELRPMMLVEATVNDQHYSTILQNAETVRLISENSSKSVSEIKAGDDILIRIEEGGRHFGTLVANETVIER